MPYLIKSLKVALLTVAGLIVALAIFLYAVTASSPETRAFKAGNPSVGSWEEAFASPVDIQFKTLQAGTIEMDRNQLLQGAPATWADRYQSLPVLSHWIKHPVKGEYLFDSAFASAFAETEQGNYGPVMATLARLSGIENSLSTSLLAQLPGSGANIQGVFMTHFHPDHSSGLDDLPAELPVIAAAAEYDFMARLANGDLFDRRPDWQHLDLDQAKPMPPFDAVLDLFGDGSVFAISTPGHTSGHLSYLVNSVEEPILLVGDASHFAFGFEQNLAPAAIGSNNQALAKRSLMQLRAFKTSYPNVGFVFGHQTGRF